METFLPLIFILISNMRLTQGSTIRITAQTPTKSNNNTYCTLWCEQNLEGVPQTVQELEIFDIIHGGRKLAKVYAQLGKQVLSNDVFVVERTFNQNMAGVELSIHDQSICDGGTFMCVVNYHDVPLGVDSDVAIIRPNVDINSSRELLEKMDSLTYTISSMKTSLAQLKQCMSCPDNSPDENFPEGWTLAFRGTPYINKSVYEAYRNGSGIPGNVENGCMQVDSRKPCTNHYRNHHILNNWTDIRQVSVVIYEKNIIVGYLVFDGEGSDFMSWFRQNNIMRSSWTDLKTSPMNYFSIEGNVDPAYPVDRHFYINRNHGGCSNDWGWFMAVDAVKNLCSYEITTTFPIFFYAKGSTGTNWTTGSVGKADVMAIYVK